MNDYRTFKTVHNKPEPHQRLYPFKKGPLWDDYRAHAQAVMDTTCPKCNASPKRMCHNGYAVEQPPHLQRIRTGVARATANLPDLS